MRHQLFQRLYMSYYIQLFPWSSLTFVIFKEIFVDLNDFGHYKIRDICTVFEIIDGAHIILKSQNEAIAHDQWSAI